MNISVKKFSKKLLSLLIALIMVFSALPLTPPISAEAAVEKNVISIWDASHVTLNNYTRRFSAVDSSAETSFSGIHFDTATRPENANYITLKNAAASFAVFDSSTASNESGALTSTGFDKGISGDHWSVTATFAYLTSNSTTIFGIGTSAIRNYTHSNDKKSEGNVADLVDIRANGSVYVGNYTDGTDGSYTLESKGTPMSSELISGSPAETKTITVEYNTGVLKIYLDDVVKATYNVDTTLFSAGVGNFFMGRNCQVFAGGEAPYYIISGGDYLGTMHFYSLSGATYTTTQIPHENPNQTINVAGFGVMKYTNSTNRKIDNNTINIVNDRYRDNFDIGFINFNISDLKNRHYVSVKDANCEFQARYAGGSDDNKGLKLYYPTKNVTEFTTDSLNSAAIPGNATAVQITTSNDSIFGSNKGQGNDSTHLADTKEYYGLTEFPSGAGEFTVSTSYAGKRLDISEAINYALDNNLNYATVIILLRQAGGATTNGGDNKWTDTYFKFNSSRITATAVDACIWNDYHPDPANAGQHIRECRVCQKTETQNCSGGTATCTQRAICEVCNAEYGSFDLHSFQKDWSYDIIHVDADEINNGYDFAGCTVCGTEDTSMPRVYDDQSQYWNTYKTELAVANTEIANTAKYTEASRNAVSAIINEVNVDDKTKSKDFIELKTRELMEAVRSLELNKYSVTLHYYDSTGTPLYSESGNIKEIVSDIPYGDLRKISVSGKFNENYVVYKWTRDVDGQNKISGLNSDTLNVVVKENADYYVFLKNTTVDNSQVGDNAVITLNNKSNKVYDIGYLDKTLSTASVTITDNTINIGGATLTAPSYSFYTLSGFTINGQLVTSGDSITITDNMVVKPVYEPTLDAFIKRAENETFLINGKAEDLAIKWNQKVILTTSNGSEVAWIAGIDRNGNGTIESTEKNVVGYGSSYSFYANSNVTFYTELTTVGDPKTSIGLFSYNANENKVTLVNNFYAPSGYTVKYAGVVLSTKTNDRATLMDQTNGRFQGGESDFSGTDSNKNQIRISVSRTANTNFDMHALAYIIVEKPDGTEETVYADNVETIHYTA